MLVLALLASAPTLSVDELMAQHLSMVDRDVNVVGWLSECEQFYCEIRNSPNPEQSGSISVAATNSHLEEKLRAAKGWKVILKARVTDHCWPIASEPELISVCSDRASRIVPESIELISPPDKKE